MVKLISVMVFVLLFLGSCSEEKKVIQPTTAVEAQKEQKTEKETNKQEKIQLPQAKAQKKEPITETLVTFVELGSVKCIPCKMMQPIMADIEKEYGSKGVKVVFYDVWTDAGAPYAKQYKIMAIPTQVFLDKDGKEYSRHTGFFPKEELIEVLKKGGIK
ncbi:MAG: hypothetical protein A2297_06135 [Elusimicrobia bacterium RIFOXYB2_FULL_48_7]|nr:MAG: hypothetical protein A2297_06135 [Elusimicrobia bacterium RIFOXYB2_FULL_48_7]